MKVLVITEEEALEQIKEYSFLNAQKMQKLDLSDEGIEEMGLEKYPIDEFIKTKLKRSIFIDALKHIREKL